MKNIKLYFGKGDKNNIFIVFTVMIIAGLMTFTLISCGTSSDKGKNAEASTQVVTDAEGETVVISVDKDGETIVYETDKSGKIKESSKMTVKSDGKTVKNTTKSAAATDKTSVQTSTTKSTQTQKTTEAQSVCYISIDGYCSGKSITVQSGDSVYSILKRSGASVSGSSSYVKGINGLYEFDKGPQSGWKYSVNGSTPSVGCGSYKVKAGDNIRWYYVTSY